MISAENGALPEGKVGGIGDVVRDVPVALVARGCAVTVVTPAYGRFAELPGAKQIESLEVSFAGAPQSFDLYEIPARENGGAVRHVVVDHPLFGVCGAGQIYCDDPPGRPFATDATKFALFCATAAESIGKAVFGKVDVIHLHDWHAAMLLVLRAFDPRYRALQKIWCAYSIHNLALQGVRPLMKDDSSLQAWYPELSYERGRLVDPRWPDTVNPMAAAIRLADRVHAVSPSYAEEILSASDVERRGYYGGEGLEADLVAAREQGRLFGILNGCEYPKKKKTAAHGWKSLLTLMRAQLPLWISATQTLRSTHYIAQSCLDRLKHRRPGMLLTSIGRITPQKIGLMRQSTSSGKPALHGVLETLGEHGLLIMIGSGDPEVETFLTGVAARFDNFIFLRGYSEELAEALYSLGDLFFMPSSYEPCGISQMLALRAGQPCLVHYVGGLRDTVRDNETGFVFKGNNPAEQADNLVTAMQRALTLFQEHPVKWKAMRKTAAAQRFEWADSVDAYLKHLYRRS
jgi:starch synthase